MPPDPEPVDVTAGAAPDEAGIGESSALRGTPPGAPRMSMSSDAGSAAC